MLKEYIQRTQLGRTIRTIRASLKQDLVTEASGACSDGLHCGELDQEKERIRDGQGSQPDPR